MALASWPSGVPYRPDAGGWSNSLGIAPLRTDIEGPASYQRARPGDDLEAVRWERAVTRAEFATLRSFVTGTLRNGALRFYMPVTLNRTDYEIRAVKIEAGSFSAVGTDNARVRVSMSLQVFPSVWAPPAPAITGISGATISGSAPDGATVRVEIAGTTLTTTSIDGGWSVQPLLHIGTYSVRFNASWIGFDWPWSASQSITLGLQAATSAIIARMTVAPTTARGNLLNRLVVDLATAGLWAKLDALYLLAAHDAQAARLNVIGPQFNLTAVNSPVFTVDRGYAGTGGAMYLDTGFNPAVASTSKYVQDSAHVSAWSLTNVQQTGGLIGNGVGSGDAHIYPWSADTKIYTQVNSASSDSIVLASSSGDFIASRLASATQKTFKDGTTVATHNKASVAPASHSFVIGAGGPSTGYTTRQIAAASIGAGLTDAEAATLHSVLRDYLTDINAVYSPEAAALIARMTVAPTTARKQLIDALITALVAAGVWAKLDALYLLAAHDAQAARLNWIADRNNLTAVNSPTFTTDRGYAGTGAAMYLDTGFNPATAPSPKYSQNSAHLSAWSLTNIQQTGGLIGNGTGSGDTHLYPWPADNRLYTQVNASGADSILLANSLGHFVASRGAADTHKAYRDGGLVATYSKSSVAPASHSFVIGAGGQSTGYTSRQIAVATIGAGLTDTEVASLRAAANTYLLALGAVA